MEQLSHLLSLAIAHEKSSSLGERQALKMKAGKVKKELRAINDESIKLRSGIKLNN